jgi:hypothetical protein
MARDDLFRFHVVTSKDSEDSRGHFTKRQVPFKGGYTIDWISKRTLHSNATLRPIHDHIMHTEAVRVAQLLFIARQASILPACVKYVKTDCVSLQGVPNKRRKLLDAAAELTFADLPQLRRRACRVEAGQALLCPEMTPCTHDAKVFQLKACGAPLQGAYSEPQREWTEPPALRPWVDLDQAAAHRHVLAGGSLLVVGSPGVGKSFWTRHLIECLRQGGARVQCVAKTHSACQNLGCGAVTADHYVRKHIRNGICSCDVLVVEELSQIEAGLWADLVKPQWLGCRYILTGDFQQFGPVCESWAGCAVPADLLQQSDLVHELAGGCRLTLAQNMRSDQKLFDFYTSLRVGTPSARPLEEALAEAKLAFRAPGQPDHVLTMSHARRVQLNARMNARFKPPGAELLQCKPSRLPNRPQSMWVWPGLVLIGAGGKTKRGLWYTVRSVNETHVTFDGLTLTREDTVQWTRLAFALVFASVQGLTLHGHVRLETNSPNFTLRHLYVGISRATSADLVSVV